MTITATMDHQAATENLSVPFLFDFRDHIALITGGATGLGEMAAQAFVQNGSTVIIASRNESELQHTTDRLNALFPTKCSYIVADLKDKAGCMALCSELKKRVDRLTVLVNNSGVMWGDDYYDFPESTWENTMGLNVQSVFYMTVGCEELLLKGATMDMPSRVINVASMAGIHTGDVTTTDDGGLTPVGHGAFSYGPSKAACIHLSKIQASKLAPKNITVNVICPGIFPSRMTHFGLDNFKDPLLCGQPTGRIGKPSDFGGVVLFLSSVASAHMTGNVIELDGGSTLAGWWGRKPDKESA